MIGNFKKAAQTTRKASLAAPKSPMGNNFMKDDKVDEEDSNFEDGGGPIEPHQSSSGHGNDNTKHFNIHGSIKEEDESSQQDSRQPANNLHSKHLSLMQNDYVKLQIESLWEKYDSDHQDMLDKIETANFLTEILVSHGLSSPGLDKINRFFRNYDRTKDGMI